MASTNSTAMAHATAFAEHHSDVLAVRPMTDSVFLKETEVDDVDQDDFFSCENALVVTTKGGAQLDIFVLRPVQTSKTDPKTQLRAGKWETVDSNLTQDDGSIQRSIRDRADESVPDRILTPEERKLFKGLVVLLGGPGGRIEYVPEGAPEGGGTLTRSKDDADCDELREVSRDDLRGLYV